MQTTAIYMLMTEGQSRLEITGTLDLLQKFATLIHSAPAAELATAATTPTESQAAPIGAPVPAAT